MQITDEMVERAANAVAYLDRTCGPDSNGRLRYTPKDYARAALTAALGDVEIYDRLQMPTPDELSNDVTTENVATRTHWRDPESLLGRLHPSAWLKVSQNDERGDFVAVIHMVHPPDESTYHYGRGKTRSDAVRAAHDGLARVIAMNKARDGEA